MPPTSKLRRLFQALSVLSAVACVLLLALLVRSYSRYDLVAFYYAPVGMFKAQSFGGRLVFDLSSVHALRESRGKGIDVRDRPLVYLTGPNRQSHWPMIWWIGGTSNVSMRSVQVPFWIPVFLAASLAVAPWIRWRFSLRSLLVAMTVVAVVLGMVAWAAS